MKKVKKEARILELKRKRRIHDLKREKKSKFKKKKLF